MIVYPSETVRYEQEVYFEDHLYGSDIAIPSGQIKIKRSSDGYFWNGTSFVVTEAYVPTTVDASGTYHYYSFTFPATSDISYVFKMRVNNDLNTECLFNVTVREQSTGGGGSSAPQFDAVAFVTNGKISFY